MSTSEIQGIKDALREISATMKEHHDENRGKFHSLNNAFNTFILENEKDRTLTVEKAFGVADCRYAAKWSEKVVGYGVGLVLTGAVGAILSLIFIS